MDSFGKFFAITQNIFALIFGLGYSSTILYLFAFYSVFGVQITQLPISIYDISETLIKIAPLMTLCLIVDFVVFNYMFSVSRILQEINNENALVRSMLSKANNDMALLVNRREKIEESINSLEKDYNVDNALRIMQELTEIQEKLPKKEMDDISKRSMFIHKRLGSISKIDIFLWFVVIVPFLVLLDG